jgi:hypothetical protein
VERNWRGAYHNRATTFTKEDPMPSKQGDPALLQHPAAQVLPEWVGVLDFQQRFPSPIEAAMAR